MKGKRLLYTTLLVSILCQPLTTLAYTKKETVYTNLDETGKIYKQTINNHLYLTYEDKEIEDETALKEILNINGKEKFTLQDRKLTWENKGKDIFYQGVTDQDNLLETKATYYLDGKEMKVKDMIGKKGSVRIHLDFSNTSMKEKKQDYVPLMVTLGTIVSDKENSNLKITNGKVIDTGTKSIAFAIASPGLYENTSIKEFENLNQIELTYDTTKFSLNNIYLLATTKLLEESDLTIFDKMDTLSSSMNTIQESMNQLESGVKEVEAGMNPLVAGSSEMSVNLKRAVDAMKQLQSGSIQLEDGLAQISSNLEGAKSMIASQNVDVVSLNLLKEKNKEAIQLLQSTNEQLRQTYENYQLANFATEESLQGYLVSLNLTQEQIKDLLTCKKTYEANQNLITLLTTNTQTLQLNITTLTLLDQLIDGINKEKVGMTSLTNGLSDLSNGIHQLYQGAQELSSGQQQLSAGMTKLATGITMLNNEGIKSLTSYATTAKKYSDQLKDVVNRSNGYKGFATSNAENTIFVYKMKAVK